MSKLWKTLTNREKEKQEKILELESSFIELEKIIELIKINPRLSANAVDKELKLLCMNIYSIREFIEKHIRMEH